MQTTNQTKTKTKTIGSICSYCGCGCRLNFIVKKSGGAEKIIGVRPDASDKVSEGKPCIKGLTLHEVYNRGRILHPMIRKNKSSKLKQVSWDDAYDFIFKKTQGLIRGEIFFGPSGKITDEDNYIMQKFARIVYETNNIDGCCTRLCHIATLKALQDMFGNTCAPTTMDDIYDRDCILIIGSNPADHYPVLYNRIMQARTKNGLKIISVRPILNLNPESADINATIHPGMEIVFLNGVMHLLFEMNACSEKSKTIDEFKQLQNVVKDYTPKKVSELCGVSCKQLQEIASMIAASKNFGIIHGMGITQHVNAIENTHSLFNLLLLKDGKLLSCRGEVNVQGVGDMGCMPDILPTGSLMTFKNLEKIWCSGKKIPVEKGLSSIEAFLLSPVKAAIISSFNPAQSLPNLDLVHKNLKKIFLVQLDSYANLTTNFADVVLPTPVLFERSGTITNGERRVRLVRQVVKPAGGSKPEWIIFKEFAKYFGASCEKIFDYASEKEIFGEIVRTIPAYSSVNAKSAYAGKDQWPDKKIKFTKFIPEQFEGIEDVRSKQYPFILTTFRSKNFFVTNEMTGKSKTLCKSPDGPYCYISADDAKSIEVKDGSMVKVSSRVSSIESKIKIDRRMPKGIVGMHFHFDTLLVNKLFPTQFDEETFTPNYKVVAVRVEKVKK